MIKKSFPPVLIKDISLSSDSFKLLVIDLEAELLQRGIPIASYGRIDWSRISKKVITEFDSDKVAARNLIKLMSDEKITGDIIVVWSNALIFPMEINSDIFKTNAINFIEEDCDMWVFAKNSKWIIEKYHEGEVCMAMPLI